MVKHVVATGIIKKFLERNEKVAFTNPLTDTISYLYTVPSEDSRLMSHELIHVDQYKRVGKLKFIVTYLWFMWTVGYNKNPYEIEAYAKEKK